MRILKHGKGLSVEAPAKINLFLEVLGRRPDGYHDLVTVMQEIALADVLEVEPAEGLSLDVEGVAIPPGGENLVLKAARLLQRSAGVSLGARFRLLKRVPPGAGLGGGSSNAAAALALCAELWDLGASTADLAKVGAEVGSDVPYFLYGGTALCTGRGEVVQSLAPCASLPLTLVWPGVVLSTQSVYEAVRAASSTPKNVDDFLAALTRGEPGAALFNRLEEAALKVCPELSDVHRGLEGRGFQGVGMSGSGSAFYGIGAGKPPEKPPGSWKVWITSIP